MSKDIIDRFMSTTNIKDTANKTVIKIMELLTRPESVEAMILMTDLEQPALSGVVKVLEDDFSQSDFPLHHNGPGANAKNRRNIGWMIRYIMREFGYTPKKEEPLQMRVGKFAGSKYFKTSAVYEKTIDNPNYSIVTQIVKKEGTIMNHNEIRRLYEQSREKERVKIVKMLNDKGLKASTRIDAGKGRSDYSAGGTISPYDLTNWKFVDAKGEGYGVFVSLQAFEQDPNSRNHHVLMDRLGVYVYEKYHAEQAFQNMHITNIDLPLTDTKLDELYEVIKELVSTNVRNCV